MKQNDRWKLPRYLAPNPDCVNKINRLHPALIKDALDIYYALRKKCTPIHITWTRRTRQEQEFLYKFGRDVPPRGVMTTNRPGYSPHEYGLALDFCFKKSDVLYTFEDVEDSRYWRSLWMEVIVEFEKKGWTSGWKTERFQPWHLENLLGKSVYEHKKEAEKDYYIEGFGNIK